MIVKSNSVRNFLFETPQKKQYTLKLVNNLPKIIPYNTLLKNNPNVIKIERREASRYF